jgi:hypothetical protein
LADALGLPHPAAIEDVTSALIQQPKSVQNAVLSRAEASFTEIIGSVSKPASVAPEATSAPVAPAQAVTQVATHSGVTMDLQSMVVYMLLASLSGWLIHKGINLEGIQNAITGSSDLHVGATMIAGAVMLVWRNVKGTNANTLAALQKS